MRRLLAYCLFALTVGSFVAAPAMAQTTYTWAATTASLWDTQANWTPTPNVTGPGSSTNTSNNDIAVFGATGTSTTIQFNFGTTGTPLYVGTIQQAAADTVARTFGSSTATAGVLVLNGTGANNSIIDDSSILPMTFAPQSGGGTGPMTIQLVQLNSTITNIVGTSTTNTGLLTISANIGEGAMPSGITKGNSGILVLSGTNSFTGPTTISSGFINYSTPGSLYNSTATSSLTTSNLIVQSGAALILRVGAAGFATTDVDNLKSLGSATGGFMNGSGIGIDTSLAALTYASNITDITYAGGSNSIGFYKFGTNALTLTGSNTYTGGTFVRTGAITVSGAQLGLPSGGNVMVGDPTGVTNTGTLNLGTATQASPSTYTLGSVTVGGTTSGTGNLITISGAAAATTSVTVSGTFKLVRGTVNTIPNGTLTLNGPLILASTPGNSATTFNATFNVGNGTSGTVNYMSSTPISFSAQQSGSNAGFLGSRLNNNAGLLTLGTSVNQDGNVTIGSTATAQMTFQNSATLRLTASIPTLLTTSLNSALTNPLPTMGFGAGNGTPAVAGIIDTNGFSTTINTPITNIVTNTGGAISIIGGGTVTIVGNNSDNGGVMLAAGTTLNINNGGVAAQPNIVASYTGGASSVTVAASVTPNLVLGQRLTGSGTTINGGTFIRAIDTTTNIVTLSQTIGATGTNLSASATSSLGTGTFTNNGGTIDNTSGSPVTLATNNPQSWAGDFTFTGTNDLNMGTGAVTMTASRVVTVSGRTLTVGGVIDDGGAGFSLTKQGAGTLNTIGANTYSGTTTITGGKLLANNASGSATGSGPVSATGTGTLGSGGTLGGTGTITGTVTVSSTTAATQGGIIYPGPGGTSAGTLNVGSMVWSPLGRYVFVHNPTDTTTGGVINGLVSGTGTLDLSTLTNTSPFDLNLLPSSFAANLTQRTYTIANFVSGITGIGGVPFTNGADVSNLFTISGLYTTAPASFATVIAGTGGASAQAIQLTFTPAAPATWTGNSSGSWNVANDWLPVAVPTSSVNTLLVFGATTHATMTNDIPGTLTVSSLTFNAGAPAYSLSGNGLNFATNIFGGLPQIVSNSSNSVTIGVALTLTNNLTVTGSGNVTLNGAIGGAGSLTVAGTGTLVLGNNPNSYSGGTNVTNGMVQVGADGALGTGGVAVSGLGNLVYIGTTTTSKTFTLSSGGMVSVATGQTVTLSGAKMIGGYLSGPGAFATNATTGAQFANTVTRPSATINSNSSLDQFINVTNGGNLNVAANLTTPLSIVGTTNAGSGTITIGSKSLVNVTDFQSYGLVNISTGASAVSTTLTNVGPTPMYFNGGSRTFVGTIGGNGLADLELNGQNAIVAGGLFVNNGHVSDNSALGISTVIADYGALVKGGGSYDNSPITRNGGRFQSGNSPGVATMGRFVFGPGGVSNYVFAISNATGQAGPTPDANGLVSGWGLVKTAQWQRTAGPTPGDFAWTADSTNKVTVTLDTLVNPTIAGTDVPGLMANFDPTKSYSWPAVEWVGAYNGPTNAAALNADTTFDTSEFANPVAGTFGWNLDPASQTLSLTYTPSAVPEPGTLALVGLAGAGLACWRRGRAISARSRL